MGPRGKRNKGKQRPNLKHKPPGRGKRKKFSIFKSKSEPRRPTKRNHEGKPNSNLKEKRPKIEYEPPRLEDSFSEEEEEDHMKQLLATFDPNLVNKKSVAIDSSDDSELEESEVLSKNSTEDEDITDDSEEEEQKEDDNREIVDEEEEVQIYLEGEIDAETQLEDESGGETQDAFARHLFYEMNSSLLNSVQSSPMLVTTSTEDWPSLGKLHIQIPKFEEETVPSSSKLNITAQQRFAAGGTVPVRISKTNNSLESLYIKSQIVNNVANANKCVLPKSSGNLPLTTLQSEIFSVINNYQDLYYTQRTLENGEEIRFAYSLHVVNHILKTRTKVLHHNARLNKKEEVPEEFRDQGLVRPKVLIIVPFRDSAYRIISMVIDILIAEDKGNVMNKSRFLEEFTGHELALPKKNPKPEDYEMLFSGNTGDDFRIGITVTKKSLKLFAEFYSSDIIIASPLGLRTIIGADGEPERDYDFLASVELLILDQTEIFLMQNWDHLLHIFNHMHLQPKESHGTDFSRVRTWSLNGWAKYYRQTLIFSSVVLPEINAIFNKKCFNYAGKVKTANPVQLGSICQVFVQLPHVFHKFSADSAIQSMEARFKFFTTKILPQQRDSLMKQTLVFVSNYFDYVRLRNYFRKEDVDFVQICEYSKEGKVARARDMFFHGDAHFILYTERYHFFNRIRVKGIRHLIFYQPPVFPNFYYEMCNLMQESNMNKKIGSVSNMTVSVLYSKYDVNQLSAIVSTDRAIRMIQSDRNVHMLVTDGK